MWGEERRTSFSFFCHPRLDRGSSVFAFVAAPSHGAVLSLPAERVGAEWAARFRAHAHHCGRRLDLGDALIAGTAKTHDLAIATRNVRDFDGLDVEVVNPWETP